MEAELFEDVIDEVYPIVAVVNMVEGAVCGIPWQRGDIQTLAIWWDGGDAGCNAEKDVAELAQLLHDGKGIPSACSLWVQNRFRIVQDYEHFFG